MEELVELVKILGSGILATIITLVVTECLRRKHAKYDYKMAVFRDVIAYRTDITGGACSTGKFMQAINQVFIAYNDCPKVIDAFEEFRKATIYKVNPAVENEKVISALVVLFKEMAKELKIDYSFSNDDLFTKPLIIGTQSK